MNRTYWWTALAGSDAHTLLRPGLGSYWLAPLWVLYWVPLSRPWGKGGGGRGLRARWAELRPRLGRGARSRARNCQASGRRSPRLVKRHTVCPAAASRYTQEQSEKAQGSVDKICKLQEGETGYVFTLDGQCALCSYGGELPTQFFKKYNFRKTNNYLYRSVKSWKYQEKTQSRP